MKQNDKGKLTLKEYAELFEDLKPDIYGGLDLCSWEFSAIEEACIALKEKAAMSDPWMPCSERLPTVEDADEDGKVFVYDEVTGSYGYRSLHFINGPSHGGFTHWMTPPAGPNGGDGNG